MADCADPKMKGPYPYPNPFKGGVLRVRSSLCKPGLVRVSIFTAAYRKISTRDFPDQPEGILDLPLGPEGDAALHWGNGLYYLVLDTPDGRRITPWLVSH